MFYGILEGGAQVVYGGGSSFGYLEGAHVVSHHVFSHFYFDPLDFVTGVLYGFGGHPVVFDCHSQVDLQFVQTYLVDFAVTLGAEVPAEGECAHAGGAEVVE